MLRKRFIDEPADDATTTSLITLRLPSGQRVTRRFLRTDKVEEVYLYVTSLGQDQLGFENAAASF